MTPAQTDTPRVDRCETEHKSLSPTMRFVEMSFLARQLERELSQAVKVAGEALDLWKRRFITFAIIHAAQYGIDHHGEGCLNAVHYDMLKEAGARLDDFKRVPIDLSELNTSKP